MTKFVTERVESIKARELVEELIINGKGVLTDFREKLIGTTYFKEIPPIIAYIQHFANGNSVGGRAVCLKGIKDGYKEYEFRTKHLRIYAVQMPGKKIILFSGIKAKADSMDNIAIFRSIKTEYIYFIKQNQKDGKTRISNK